MRGTFVGLSLLLTSLTWAADNFQKSEAEKTQKPGALTGQPFDVKTGLWENTMTTALSGQMAIPPEKLAKLSAEQRARIEAAMNARSGQSARTTTYRSCVTKDDLKKMPFSDKNNCTETLVSSSKTQAEVKLVCTMEGVNGTADIQIHATSEQSITGSGHGTATMGGRTMDTIWTLTGKWVQESCGDVR